MLHLSRSYSGRSLCHIPSGPLATRHSGTQTDSSTAATVPARPRSESGRSDSLKRPPRWKRSSRLRKSVAVMEGEVRLNVREGRELGREGRENPGFSVELGREGRDNPGFSVSPREQERVGRERRLYSARELPSHKQVGSWLTALSSWLLASSSWLLAADTAGGASSLETQPLPGQPTGQAGGQAAVPPQVQTGGSPEMGQWLEYSDKRRKSDIPIT